MDQDRPRPSPARWMQPNPRPFWGTKLFLLNLIVCSTLVMVAAAWVFWVEPARKARERAEIEKATTAKSYAPRAADSKEPKEVRFDGMLDKVADDADPELRSDDAFRYLAKYMATVDASKLSDQARLVDYQTLMEKPDEVRGLTVRLHLMFWKAPYGLVRLDRPAGSVETVTRAYLAESAREAKHVYFIDFVEAIPEIDSDSEVVVDAVFLRRVKYDAPNKAGFHQAPLFIARSISKVQEPTKPLSQRYIPLTIALGSGVFLFLAFITVKSWMASRPAPPAARRSLS